jgi:hypothetical protein
MGEDRGKGDDPHYPLLTTNVPSVKIGGSDHTSFHLELFHSSTRFLPTIKEQAFRWTFLMQFRISSHSFSLSNSPIASFDIREGNCLVERRYYAIDAHEKEAFDYSGTS